MVRPDFLPSQDPPSILSLRRAIADYFRNSSECASMASKCTLQSAPESNLERTHVCPYFGSRGHDYYQRCYTSHRLGAPGLFILSVLALLSELIAYRTLGIEISSLCARFCKRLRFKV